MIKFQKATKENLRARVALYGPSGAGKTYTALRLAGGLGKKIAAVCTEHGSMRKYADKFVFDVMDAHDNPDGPTVDFMVESIQAAEQGGYDVLIIDSLTHTWKSLCEEVSRIAKAKFSGNTHAAWMEGTPKQARLIEAILGAKLHIICTMRARTEWIIEQKGNKKEIRRVGLGPQQGKGIEFEFDLLMELSDTHIGQVVKDRSSIYQDKFIEKPGEEMGRGLLGWLTTDRAVAARNQARQEALTPAPAESQSKPVVADWRSYVVNVGSAAVKGRKLGDLDVAVLKEMADKIVVSPTSSEDVRELRRMLDIYVREKSADV